MNSWIPLIYLALFAVLCGVIIFLHYRSSERMFAQQSQLIKDLCDRFFISKNLAPTGIDVAANYEEIRKKNNSKVRPSTPPAIGPVDRVTAQLLADAETRHLRVENGGSKGGAIA